LIPHFDLFIGKEDIRVKVKEALKNKEIQERSKKEPHSLFLYHYMDVEETRANR
jgi:hypothetical protein